MVQSRLNNEINYEEKKGIDKSDKGKETKTYVVDIDALNIKALIGIGTDNTKYIEKSIIYFPIYLVLKSKNKSEGGESVFEKIGVFEIPSNNLVNIVDDQGELDLERLEDLSIKKEDELGYELIEPLLFSYITKEYIQDNNESIESFMSEPDNELDDDEEEEGSGEEPEEDYDDDDDDDYKHEKDMSDLETSDGSDDYDEDDEDDEDEEDEEGDEGEELDDFSDLSSDSDVESINKDDSSSSDEDEEDEEDEEDDDDSENDDSEHSDESDSESDPELDFNYIFDNWVTDYTKDTNFNIVDNEGGGDCFFAVIRDAYKSIDKVFSVKALRELLSREATQEVFETYRTMYKQIRENIRDTVREMKKLKKKNSELEKQINAPTGAKDKKSLTRKQKKKIVDEAKDNKKEFDKLAKEKQEGEMLIVEYQFMKGIKTLCDFKKKIKSSDFWAETWAISTLERVLNTKIVILSSESYKDGDVDNVLQCGQANDSIIQEKGEFTPDYYIVMDYTGGHYMLVTHKDSHIFTYMSLPEKLKSLIADKCLEGKDNSGLYALIPEFKELKK